MSTESLRAIEAAKTPDELRALLDRVLAEYCERNDLDPHLASLSADVSALVHACKAALFVAYQRGVENHRPCTAFGELRRVHAALEPDDVYHEDANGNTVKIIQAIKAERDDALALLRTIRDTSQQCPVCRVHRRREDGYLYHKRWCKLGKVRVHPAFVGKEVKS